MVDDFSGSPSQEKILPSNPAGSVWIHGIPSLVHGSKCVSQFRPVPFFNATIWIQTNPCGSISQADHLDPSGSSQIRHELAIKDDSLFISCLERSLQWASEFQDAIFEFVTLIYLSYRLHKEIRSDIFFKDFPCAFYLSGL